MRKVVVVGAVALCMLFVSIGAAAQDEWIPGLASFVLPGLGQVLNDQMDKAILHFGVDIAIVAVGWYVGGLMPYAYYAIPALHLAWAIYSGFDAYNVAKDRGFSIGFVENGVSFSYTF
jgi:hypothetical protein